MNKWLNQFLEKPDISDNTDRFDSNVNMSDLSGRPQRVLDQNLENMPQTAPDISDRFDPNMNMSDLSGCPQRVLDQTLENMPETAPDISDRFDSNVNMSGLSGCPRNVFEKNFSSYGKHDFEERIAIAEIDGNQNPFQAHRIAYLDAFISILWNLAEDNPYQDWLAEKIQIALATLEGQNFSRLNCKLNSCLYHDTRISV